jgi:hypothetical protein
MADNFASPFAPAEKFPGHGNGYLAAKDLGGDVRRLEVEVASITAGGGDASAAKQDAQTALLTSILAALALEATSDLTSVTKAISTATDTPIVAAGGGTTTIRVHRITLNVSAACTLTFKSAATQLREPMVFYGPATMVYDFSGRPWLTTAANQALNLTSSNTATVNITVDYVQG